MYIEYDIIYVYLILSFIFNICIMYFYINYCGKSPIADLASCVVPCQIINLVDYTNLETRLYYIAYGQFSNVHDCFCGLDPGNLKFETVQTRKRHICFLGFETLNLKFCDLKL